MTFGEAVEHIKKSPLNTVARAGWNGKGMWLAHVFGASATVGNQSVGLSPFVVMKAADGSFVPWLASQTDVLATDWLAIA